MWYHLICHRTCHARNSYACIRALCRLLVCISVTVRNPIHCLTASQLARRGRCVCTHCWDGTRRDQSVLTCMTPALKLCYWQGVCSILYVVHVYWKHQFVSACPGWCQGIELIGITLSNTSVCVHFLNTALCKSSLCFLELVLVTSLADGDK